MNEFQTKLKAAREEVARLERYAAGASCREIGCDMEFSGGKNCGCENGACSVPVYICTRCGDSDYGDNAEAVERRAACSDRTEGNFASEGELRAVLGVEEGEPLEVDEFGAIQTHDGAWKRDGERWRFHAAAEDLAA